MKNYNYACAAQYYSLPLAGRVREGGGGSLNQVWIPYATTYTVLLDQNHRQTFTTSIGRYPPLPNPPRAGEGTAGALP